VRHLTTTISRIPPRPTAAATTTNHDLDVLALKLSLDQCPHNLALAREAEGGGDVPDKKERVVINKEDQSVRAIAFFV